MRWRLTNSLYRQGSKVDICSQHRSAETQSSPSSVVYTSYLVAIYLGSALHPVSRLISCCSCQVGEYIRATPLLISRCLDSVVSAWEALSDGVQTGSAVSPQSGLPLQSRSKNISARSHSVFWAVSLTTRVIPHLWVHLTSEVSRAPNGHIARGCRQHREDSPRETSMEV